MEDIRDDTRPLQVKTKAIDEPKKKNDTLVPTLTEKNKERELLTFPYLHETTEPYRPSISFLSRLKEANKDKKFSKIFDMFSKININLPLLDVIRNVSGYAKFFKELSIKKRNYEKNEKVIVSEVASAVFQQSLPHKLEDPGSFIVNISMGDKKIARAMLDLRASINLMPYSVYSIWGWEN